LNLTIALNIRLSYFLIYNYRCKYLQLWERCMHKSHLIRNDSLQRQFLYPLLRHWSVLNRLHNNLVLTMKLLFLIQLSNMVKLSSFKYYALWIERLRLPKHIFTCSFTWIKLPKLMTLKTQWFTAFLVNFYQTWIGYLNYKRVTKHKFQWSDSMKKQL